MKDCKRKQPGGHGQELVEFIEFLSVTWGDLVDVCNYPREGRNADFSSKSNNMFIQLLLH